MFTYTAIISVVWSTRFKTHVVGFAKIQEPHSCFIYDSSFNFFVTFDPTLFSTFAFQSPMIISVPCFGVWSISSWNIGGKSFQFHLHPLQRIDLNVAHHSSWSIDLKDGYVNRFLEVWWIIIWSELAGQHPAARTKSRFSIKAIPFHPDMVAL